MLCLLSNQIEDFQVELPIFASCMHTTILYEFQAEMWQYQTPKGGWYFVSLPIEISHEIRTNLKWQEEGWGRMKVEAKIGNSTWKTSIWFDTKYNTYLLPIKTEIRIKNHLKPSEIIAVSVCV